MKKDRNHRKSSEGLAKGFFKNLEVRMKLGKQEVSKDKS